MSSTKLPSPRESSGTWWCSKEVKYYERRERKEKKKNYAIFTRNTKPVTRNFS